MNDPTAPWIPRGRIPHLQQDFTAAAHGHASPAKTGSTMVQQDDSRPALTPPPEIRYSADKASFDARWQHEHHQAILHQGAPMKTQNPQTQQAKNQGPIQSFKDGAISAKIWENGPDGQKFVTASIGKIYKDKASGKWKESRNFGAKDLEKLRNLLPQLTEEMAKWQGYYRETGQAQTQPNDMVAMRDQVMQQATHAPQQPAPQQEQNYQAAPQPQPAR